MPIEYNQRQARDPQLPVSWSNIGPEYNGPCNCCGATYQQTKGCELQVGASALKSMEYPQQEHNKGILIIGDKVYEESDDGGLQVAHVDTKQGVLTVIVRRA